MRGGNNGRGGGGNGGVSLTPGSGDRISLALDEAETIVLTDDFRSFSGDTFVAFADGYVNGLGESFPDDVIDLSAVDADTTTRRVDDAFVFIGEDEFSGTAGELRIEVRNVVAIDDDATQPLRAPAADAPASMPGQGVDGMRRRLEAVGGRLDVRRRAEEGGQTFTATAWVPVRSAS